MPLPVIPADIDDVTSAVGLGWLAAMFATEPGRLPEFVAWCNTRTADEDAAWLLAVPPDAMQDLADTLRALFILFTRVRSIKATISSANDQI